MRNKKSSFIGKKYNLDYLNSKPIKIYWEVVSGPTRPSEIQMYDVVFDDYDYKIRGLVK